MANPNPPYATLCVQGIKDGVRRSALEAEFEAFGPLVRVDIAPSNSLRGVQDSRLAFVEFERREDARKAMRALNGRYVQGKCVMIQFARGTPGVRSTGPRRGIPEPIPQTPNAALLAAKFPQPSGDGVLGHLGRLRSPRRRSRSRPRKSRSRQRVGRQEKEKDDRGGRKETRQARPGDMRHRSRSRSRSSPPKRPLRDRSGARRRACGDRSLSRWRPSPSRATPPRGELARRRS